jgi:hypothetical protein
VARRCSIRCCPCQLCVRAVLALYQQVPALLRDPTFLVRERRDGFRPGSCKRPFELGRPCRGFALDHFVEPLLGDLDVAVDPAGALDRSGEPDRCGLGDGAGRKP